MLHGLRAKVLQASRLPLRLSTNNTDQAQERSCKTSPLRITLGRTKAAHDADGSDSSTFCLKWQKNELQADSRSDGYPGSESAVRETSDARKSKRN